MRRWAIGTANIALFVACCFLAAGIVDAILAETLLPARTELAPPAAVVSTAQRDWSERQTILDRNLFGAKLSGEVVEPVVEQEDLAETKLPLKLLGTVAGEDNSVSNAAIQDLGTRKHQVVFVGDSLTAHPKVAVVRIERMRVVLQNGPKREELVLDEDAKASAPPTSPRTARRAAARPRRARQPNAAAERVEKMQEAGNRTTASLYSQARIVPKWEDGQMVGVQLNQIKAGSLYQKIGIKSGDVITALNGIAIDSPQASSRLLTEFTQAEDFTIEILDGETINVAPDQLASLLEENDS